MIHFQKCNNVRGILQGHAFVLQIWDSDGTPLLGQILSPPLMGLIQLRVLV
jgi:hypothetical protein